LPGPGRNDREPARRGPRRAERSRYGGRRPYQNVSALRGLLRNVGGGEGHHRRPALERSPTSKRGWRTAGPWTILGVRRSSLPEGADSGWRRSAPVAGQLTVGGREPPPPRSRPPTAPAGAR
jgi:hypothetical protein